MHSPKQAFANAAQNKMDRTSWRGHEEPVDRTMGPRRPHRTEGMGPLDTLCIRPELHVLRVGEGVNNKEPALLTERSRVGGWRKARLAEVRDATCQLRA